MSINLTYISCYYIDHGIRVIYIWHGCHNLFKTYVALDHSY